MGKKIKTNQKGNKITDSERIRKLENLLRLIDSPNEGDKIFFTLVGDATKYRGTIKKKIPKSGVAIYQIVCNTRPKPIGVVDTIIYKGKTFQSGKWKSL